MCNADIRFFTMGLGKGQIWSCLCHPFGHLLSRTNWRGGFQNDQIPLLQYRSNGLAGGFDITKVRFVIAFERCGYGNQKGIRRLGSRHGFQVTLGHGRMNDHIQIWFDDMNFAAVDGIYRLLIYIDTNDLFLSRSKNCRGRKSNITEANDRNCFK